MRSSILHIAACFGLFLLTAPAAAQSVSVDDLRNAIHQDLVSGHSRIGYSAAYDALGALYSDPANPLNVILFYTNRSQPNTLRVNSNNRDGWNREHLWPQSHGTRSEPMKSDLHHLRPTDATVNSNRGSLDFDNGGSPEGEAPDTFRDADSFEPRDEIKGDVARSLFYMDVRYEGSNGEPDLTLVDGTTGRGSTLGDLCTLLDWHSEDPVSDQERDANNIIESIQGNRNAFVDDPELAQAIFGPSCGTPGNLAPYSGTMTTALASTPAPDGFRMATWNIENLWHEDGEALRGSSTVRSSGDFDAIRSVRDKLGADIVGLQEMGSLEAVELIFPPEEWQIVFSMRFGDDLAGDPDKLMSADTRDIYTALVVRRSLGNVIATERIELDVLHEDGRPVREGIAALVDIDGKRIWVASIHLKSGCFTDNDLTRRDDCRTLAKQIPILEDWFDEKVRHGHHVMLLGDFNRQLDRGSDVVRRELDDNDPTDLYKVPHRQKLECSAFRPGKQISIDYLLMDEGFFDYVSVPSIPKLDVSDQQVSDHCPVFVDVILE